MLRAIVGSEPLKHGSVLINGIDIQQITPQQLAQQVAFVTTERIRIANLSCRDVVALGRAPYTNWIGRMQPEDETIVMQSLEKVGMASYAFRTMDKMSDGECQRVMIARALAQQTPIILLDEPTSFLDMPNRYDLCRLLADLAHQENKCIIFSTHELDIAQSLCADYSGKYLLNLCAMWRWLDCTANCSETTPLSTYLKLPMFTIGLINCIIVTIPIVNAII